MATSSVGDAGFQNMLECAVCFERLKNPRLLSCGHHFCENCLTSLAADYENKQMKCPTCRSETSLSGSGVAGLPRHYMAGELLEKTASLLAASQTPTTRYCDVCKDRGATASTRCQDCARNLCKDCFENHLEVKAFNGHKTVTITDSLFCEEHSDVVVALFCMDCKVGICLDCVIRKHSKHNSRDIGELAAETRKTLEDFLKAPAVVDDRIPLSFALQAAADNLKEDREKYIHKIKTLREALRTCLAKLDHLEATFESNCKAEGKSLSHIITEQSILSERRKNLWQLAECLLKESSDIEVVVRGQNIPSPYSLGASTEFTITKSTLRGSLEKVTAAVKEFAAECDIITKQIIVRPAKPVESLTKVREMKVNQTINGICLSHNGGERCVALRTQDKSAPIKVDNYCGDLKEEFGGGIEGVVEFLWSRDIAVDTKRALYVMPCQDKIVRMAQSGALYDNIPLAGQLAGIVYIRREDTYAVSVWDKHKIYMTNADNKQVIRQFGSFGVGNEEFNSPSYFCVYNSEPELTFVISDRKNNRFRVCDTSGKHVATYGIQGRGKGELTNPWDVCVDPAGRLVVCDPGNDRVISCWEEAGKVKSRVLLTKNQLGDSWPRCVDIDIQERQLYLATNDDRLQIYSF